MDSAPSNLTIFAAVDVLVLLASIFFLWRGARRLSRFVQLSRRTSFETALRRARQTAHRQAIRCATDEHYYLSRLALFFCANLVSVAAVIFAAIALSVPPHAVVGMSAWAWTWVANAFLLLFLILAARNVFRTVKLTRKVMAFRRKLRSLSHRRSG